MINETTFIFEIVNFPLLDGDVLAPLPMVFTFRKLFVFSRVSSHVDEFININTFLTSK